VIDSEIKDAVAKKVAEVLSEAKALRQLLHQYPEGTWQEEQTSKKLREVLSSIPGVKLEEPIGKYGVVAHIEGSSPGPVVALRADMDGLPICETTRLAYASKNKNTMHACGHDGHMANLLATARVLSSLRNYLRGRVKLIFQPAEEGGGGAKVLCDQDVLERPKVDAIFGLHGWPELPCGSIGVRSGAILASTDEIQIEVIGSGGHAGFPHLCSDTVLAAARVVDGLQSVVSRKVAPTDAVVLSVTEIHGGSANNVIPNQVTMRGTLRTISESTRSACHAMIASQAQAIAEANGVKAKVHINQGYPVTMNHFEPTEFVRKLGVEILGSGQVHQLAQPSMGGEDFSYYLQKIPGTFFFLGLDDGRAGGFPSLHRPDFDFNDQALKTSITLFSHIALAYGR